MKSHHHGSTLIISLILIELATLPVCRCSGAKPARTCRTVVIAQETPYAVLHNPDMGWVLYENYPVDPDPHGSSTLLTLPNENFAGVDTVAVMFSWQDIEKSPDDYDFSKVDFAYDYWASRGKAIQLRVSSETLLWWDNRTPPAGTGMPDYVFARLSPDEKQSRELDGAGYMVVDARNSYYRERLAKFLWAIDAHFSDARPVTLIDLRGFGVWGEWHSGFKYPTLELRRDALMGIIDLWSEILRNHRLALSGSYDPDGPKTLYEGSTKKFESQSTKHYDEYLAYSAFDYALTKTNLSFRRDGCGGAVHSNERKLNDEAFRLGRGPMFSEFMDGYAQSKKGDKDWIAWKVEDALSLHPNYLSLLGWQGADSFAFVKERPDLFNSALNQMGYRLVPTHVDYPTSIAAGVPFEIETHWVNRGVGRTLRDYEFRISLIAPNGSIAASTSTGSIETSRWVKGQSYDATVRAKLPDVPAGSYQIAINLYDEKSQRDIELPITDCGPEGLYRIGPILVAADKRASGAVRCRDE